MSLSVEIIFEYMKISPINIWKTLVEVDSTLMPPDSSCMFYDKEITFAKVIDEIVMSGKSHFEIDSKKILVNYGGVGNCSISFLLIEKCIQSLDEGAKWVEPFMKLDNFIQARVYDKEYEYWQNASDPLEYKSVGKDINNLPMKSNELPPPLEQMVVDTSKNPGRRILQDGYVEAIGASMWFGNLFWNKVGGNKDDILKQNFFDCYEVMPSVIFLQSAKKAFNESSGSQGQVQVELRKLLFQN